MVIKTWIHTELCGKHCLTRPFQGLSQLRPLYERNQEYKYPDLSLLFPDILPVFPIGWSQLKARRQETHSPYTFTDKNGKGWIADISGQIKTTLHIGLTTLWEHMRIKWDNIHKAFCTGLNMLDIIKSYNHSFPFFFFSNFIVKNLAVSKI